MKRLMVFGAIVLMFTMFVGCMNPVTPEDYTYKLTVDKRLWERAYTTKGGSTESSDATRNKVYTWVLSQDNLKINDFIIITLVDDEESSYNWSTTENGMGIKITETSNEDSSVAGEYYITLTCE